MTRKWEYKALTTSSAISVDMEGWIESDLNLLGDEGWELVTIIRRTMIEESGIDTEIEMEELLAVFKREKA